MGQQQVKQQKKLEKKLKKRFSSLKRTQKQQEIPMLELYNKLAKSFNNLYHWHQDMLQHMKDLTENLETASEASDH